jgi:hypothetical protein
MKKGIFAEVKAAPGCNELDFHKWWFSQSSASPGVIAVKALATVTYTLPFDVVHSY